MKPENRSGKSRRLWTKGIGLTLLLAVPTLAIVFLSPNPFAATASGNEADLAVMRNGINSDFLVLDAPGKARPAEPPMSGDTSAKSGGPEVETRLNSWTPTLGGGVSRGN